MPCESLDGLRETKIHSRARDGCHMSTFSDHDVTILLVLEQRFSKGFLSCFLSLVDIGNSKLLKLSHENSILGY